MKQFRGRAFPYILAIYLIYTIIPSFSVYSLGGWALAAMLLCLLICGLITSPRAICKKPENKVFVFGWCIVFLFSILIHGAIPGVMLMMCFVFCCFYLFLNKNVRQEAFTKYAWILSIFLFLSAVEYVFYMTTGKGVVLSSVTRVTEYRESHFFQFIFNIIRTDNFIPRFQGLFIEPGSLGTTCAFMLFATWKMKSMKFPFFVFLICGMLSMSLAFYIYLLIFLMVNVKLSVKRLVMSSMILIMFMSSFGEYFEAKIINRVNGVDNFEELDNRTSESMDRAFRKAMSSGELIAGIGIGKTPDSLSYDGGNAGAKKWIYEYGIISLVIVFLIYNLVYYRRCDNKLEYGDWIFLIVYWITFYKSVSFLVPSLFAVYSIMPELNKTNNSSLWKK